MLHFGERLSAAEELLRNIWRGFVSATLPDGTTTNGSLEPVIWSPSGTVTVLQNVGALGGDQAVGINSAGYAVG